MFQNFKVLRKNALMIRDFGAILKQRRIVAPFDGTSVHAPWVEMLLLARARPPAKPRRPAGGAAPCCRSLAHWLTLAPHCPTGGPSALAHPDGCAIMDVWCSAGVGSLAHWFIGSLAHWLIGSHLHRTQVLGVGSLTRPPLLFNILVHRQFDLASPDLRNLPATFGGAI